MTEPSTIIYPTIDLFSYDLAEGLGQREDKIDQNRENFWRQIYGDKLTISQLETFSQIELEISDYIELLGKTEPKYFAAPFDGFYYPVKLGDTYALQVDCSSDRDDPTLEYAPRDIKNFSEIQQNILSHLHSQNNQLSNHLGQTWFVWGQLTSDTQEPLTIAKQIYEQLQICEDPNWNKDLKTDIKATQTKLFGAECFELWQLPSNRADHIKQSKHLLICLFSYNSSDSSIKDNIEKIKIHSPTLMRLFLYRHKIIWAYARSRYHKTNLKNATKHIQLAIADDSSKTDLVALQLDLKSTLNLMTTYAEELIYLEDQKNTIETNLRNYQKKLKRLEDPDRDIDLPFLEKFTAIVTNLYINQITTDLTSLSPAQKSLENSVRNIEGIINIEQAKSDRNLNQTIFAVGTGLGTSQVAAGVIVAQFPAISNDKPNCPPLIYMSGVFFISILIGAFFGFLIWLYVQSHNSKKT
jgi:hypothetical protein